LLEKDDLDDVIMAEPGPREAKKMEHDMLNRAASNPIRRKIIKEIGIYGAFKENIMKNINLQESAFKFQTDYLLHQGLIKEENGKYTLTDKGLEILEISK
jgi:predicted transcriptional regulator